MKRRDFCKALACSAALAPGLTLPRAEAAAKNQTVGRAVPSGKYISFHYLRGWKARKIRKVQEISPQIPIFRSLRLPNKREVGYFL